MTKKKTAKHPLDDGLLAAMQAIDNQISREVSSRSPAERTEHGVQKWEPIDTRIENVTVLVMKALGTSAVQLDSVLVLAQAMLKSLQLVVEDLGEDGLGEVRSGYCRAAGDRMQRTLEKLSQALGDDRTLM